MVLSPISFRFAAPLDPRVAGGGAIRRDSHPDWVLLHKSARISGHRNSTTAECHTMEGQPIQVSFWLVDPPGVSYFTVHCPGLDREDFTDEPYIRCADAAFVLFSVAFAPVHGRSFRDPGRRCTQRFVYRAGPGKPSLHRIPDPDIVRPNGAFGLLPCGVAGSEHYAVVFLHRRFMAGDKATYYDLHVFSSVTGAWSSKGTLLGLSEDDQKLLAEHAIYKVIKVGASSLGYVDLSWGILLVCDVFSECPVIKYISLPASRVCNMDEDGEPYIAPQYCFDVSSCNNLIKFVEVEFDDRDRRSLSNQGWKATTWNRDISWDDWRVCSSVDVANISVDPSYSDLLPELWNDKTKELELKKLVFYTPTLSKHDDDFLFVMSKLKCEDDKAWVITVDMKHASVEAIAPYSTKGRSLDVWHCPCTFPKYLELAPGADVTMRYKRVRYRVLQLLLAQDLFMELDERFKFGRPTYDECKSLLNCCPVSSLPSDMQEVLKYAFYAGYCEAAPKAVDFCSRALENFDVVLRELVSDPSVSTLAIRSHFDVILQGLDSILHMVSPSVRVHVDACHDKRDKAKFELCEKPGHTKDYKLQETIFELKKTGYDRLEVIPDAELPHWKTHRAMVFAKADLEKTGQTKEKPFHTSNDSRGKKKKKRVRRRKANCDGRAVIPDRGLERWKMLLYLLIFLCLLSATYILVM